MATGLDAKPNPTTAPDDVRIWRERALDATREAALAVRVLQNLLASPAESPGSPMLPVPPLAEVGYSKQLISNIEAIEQSAGYCTIRGWAFLESSPDCRETKVSCIVRTSLLGFALPVYQFARPDVATAFPIASGQDAHRQFAGFCCRYEPHHLDGDSAEAFLILQDAGRATHCSKPFRVPAGNR